MKILPNPALRIAGLPNSCGSAQPDHHQRDAGTAFFKQKRFSPHSENTGKTFS
ncbi:hypothetical protein GKD00_03195 [Lactobacillus ruminis]|nr:hypothetical protein [Ligilactobacillus ruminis]MSB53981.1 hypothetical protein [Ligilactobacillus ruminis]MSB55948.1 hypothetical protein [Ligilactobacillus ruminis]MSB80996.1 hypothetical protein [Ligilactobacillus ruminis]MSB91542.1 hypothetical protein [Ligilactobacillus ruminis]